MRARQEPPRSTLESLVTAARWMAIMIGLPANPITATDMRLRNSMAIRSAHRLALVTDDKPERSREELIATTGPYVSGLGGNPDFDRCHEFPGRRFSDMDAIGGS